MAFFDRFKKKGPQEPEGQLPEPVAEQPVPEEAPAFQPAPAPAEPVYQEPAPQEPAGEESQEQPAENAKPDRPTLTAEETRKLQAVLNRTYPGLAMYVRDADLTYEQYSKYNVGDILWEKAHVDASRRVMGMVTSHRYAILSNHMLEPTSKELEKGANWGLRVANKGSHFKVLGKHTYKNKSVIFLLHLPDDEDWKLFKNTVIDSDEALIRKCIARFEAKCLLAPVPDLAAPEWLDRCRFPIGMDNDGNLFPIE